MNAELQSQGSLLHYWGVSSCWAFLLVSMDHQPSLDSSWCCWLLGNDPASAQSWLTHVIYQVKGVKLHEIIQFRFHSQDHSGNVLLMECWQYGLLVHGHLLLHQSQQNNWWLCPKLLGLLRLTAAQFPQYIANIQFPQCSWCLDKDPFLIWFCFLFPRFQPPSNHHHFPLLCIYNFMTLFWNRLWIFSHFRP